MPTLRARELSLEDAHQLLGLEPVWDAEFEDFLTLPDVTEAEQSQLLQLRSNFERYLVSGKISAGQTSEGQVRIVTVNPLLQIAGYDQFPLEYRSEENIAQIFIEEQDLYIRGRFDLVVVNRKLANSQQEPLWILVVESKNLSISESSGIAQLLTYAHTSLNHQDSVWGLVTNGETYRFFYIEKGSPIRYHHMPSLSLMRSRQLIQLLQVLKAIRD
jgi:Type I restriction enzyme R protein N terminus (HSDR_N)